MTEIPEDGTSHIFRTLVGALWFPAFFLFGFLLCYILPFHAPSPHHIQVAVSDRSAAASLRAGFARSAPGAFDILPASNAAAAQHMVLHRDAVAAYSVGPTTDTLYVAGADGSPLESVVSAAFGQVAGQQGRKLSTVDLVPPASGDLSGTGLFYVALIWNILPYITVMMLLSVVVFNRRAKVFTLVGVGAFISVVAYFFALAVHVVPNKPLAIVYAF